MQVTGAVSEVFPSSLWLWALLNICVYRRYKSSDQLGWLAKEKKCSWIAWLISKVLLETGYLKGVAARVPPPQAQHAWQFWHVGKDWLKNANEQVHLTQAQIFSCCHVHKVKSKSVRICPNLVRFFGGQGLEIKKSIDFPFFSFWFSFENSLFFNWNFTFFSFGIWVFIFYHFKLHFFYFKIHFFHFKLHAFFIPNFNFSFRTSCCSFQTSFTISNFTYQFVSFQDSLLTRLSFQTSFVSIMFSF